MTHLRTRQSQPAALGATTERMAPHFCNPACYATHATERDLAGDAAELCDDARHFELYPDTTSELTEAHVDAHLVEMRRRQSEQVA